MNPDAQWSDGAPVTVDDVIWSYEIQKELNPANTAFTMKMLLAQKRPVKMK